MTVMPQTGSFSSAESPVPRAAAAPLQQPPVVEAQPAAISTVTGFEALFDEQQEASTACVLEWSAWWCAPCAWAA